MSDQGQEVTREELRPGLTMIKRRTIKDDGRYLIYYEFERAPRDSNEAAKGPAAE